MTEPHHRQPTLCLCCRCCCWTLAFHRGNTDEHYSGFYFLQNTDLNSDVSKGSNEMCQVFTLYRPIKSVILRNNQSIRVVCLRLHFSVLTWKNIASLFNNRREAKVAKWREHSALTNKCDPGWNPVVGRSHMWVKFNLLLILFLVPRDISPGASFLPSPPKPTLPNSNSRSGTHMFKRVHKNS